MTGGPGGGKTTAADLFRRELGPEVVIVPRSASIRFVPHDQSFLRKLTVALTLLWAITEELRD